MGGKDNYPFGMVMDGRNYSVGSSYRYSINGQEKTLEIAPNTTTAEFWQYDSRIGRRWNVDPIFKEYESPYAVFGNNPNWLIDANGADTSKSLSNKQLVDAIKIGYNFINNHVSNKTFVPNKVKTDSYEDQIDKAALAYYKENQTTMDHGAYLEFRDQAFKYYYGLAEVAHGVNSDKFNALGTTIINNKSVNNANTIIATKFEIDKYNGTLDFVKATGFQALGICIAGSFGVRAGPGPRMPSSSPQQALVSESSQLVTSQVEGFYIRAATTSSNGIYTKTIQTLVYTGENNAGSLIKLMRTFEVEARAAGANVLRIHGVEIVEPKILQLVQKYSNSFGYQLEQSGQNSIIATKQLLK